MAFSYSGEIEPRIQAKAAENESFGAQLIADPKARTRYSVLTYKVPYLRYGGERGF